MAGAASLATAFAHLPELRHLNLHYNDIGAAGAAALAAGVDYIPHLQHLDVGGNYLCAEGAEALAAAMEHVPKLEYLDARCNSLGGAGAETLAAGLVHVPGLRYLCLSRNEIGSGAAAGRLDEAAAREGSSTGGPAVASRVRGASEGSVEAARALAAEESMRGEAAAATLALALVNVPHLRHLDVSGNYIGAVGLDALRAAIGLYVPGCITTH